MSGIAAIEQALSLERFARYVAWAGGDRDRALALYTLNTRLSEALYAPLQALELSLRNRIHVAMGKTHGARWFEEHGLLQAPHQREQVTHAIAQLVKEDKDPTAGRVVAALTFSFWTAMVSPVYEDLWRATLNAIAVRTDGKRLSRKQLSRPLSRIRILRNRVAHHEPILHWNLPDHHGQVLDIISWLSPEVARWLSTIDRFTEVYPTAGYRLADDGADRSKVRSFGRGIGFLRGIGSLRDDEA